MALMHTKRFKTRARNPFERLRETSHQSPESQDSSGRSSKRGRRATSQPQETRGAVAFNNRFELHTSDHYQAFRDNFPTLGCGTPAIVVSAEKYQFTYLRIQNSKALCWVQYRRRTLSSVQANDITNVSITGNGTWLRIQHGGGIISFVFQNTSSCRRWCQGLAMLLNIHAAPGYQRQRRLARANGDQGAEPRDARSATSLLKRRRLLHENDLRQLSQIKDLLDHVHRGFHSLHAFHPDLDGDDILRFTERIELELDGKFEMLDQVTDVDDRSQYKKALYNLRIHAECVIDMIACYVGKLSVSGKKWGEGPTNCRLISSCDSWEYKEIEDVDEGVASVVLRMSADFGIDDLADLKVVLFETYYPEIVVEDIYENMKRLLFGYEWSKERYNAFQNDCIQYLDEAGFSNSTILFEKETGEEWSSRVAKRDKVTRQR